MKLAIKGNETRGNEVIEILEMLGGKNLKQLEGNSKKLVYTINSSYNRIEGLEAVSNVYKVFTIEEFLEKYPYKVGDMVIVNGDDSDFHTITSMRWHNEEEQVYYDLLTKDGYDTCSWEADEMIPYKEQKAIPPYMDYDVRTSNKESMQVHNETLVEIDLTREMKIADKVEIILGDYEVKEEDGKTYLVKKQPKYPKTYQECCKVLGIGNKGLLYTEYNKDLLQSFQKLIICRDAYWKIAGEEMGLGKPWEPDWKDISQSKHSIWFNNEGICTKSNIISYSVQHVLTFPTVEMRDAFYENFKDLIEECKKFL